MLRTPISTLAALLILPILAACAGERSPLTDDELAIRREQVDARFVDDNRAVMNRIVARAKTKLDQSGSTSERPTIDVLVISGGGDWGAFGVGVLTGWRKVNDPQMRMPTFDVVTGVSTGALIAPFAFLGTEADVAQVEKFYRNPKKDWVRPRGMLYFLPNHMSFAEVPGLERELRETVTTEMVDRIVAEGDQNRVLLVNTTNIDDGGMQVWDIVTESRRGDAETDIDRVREILLASAGIPGAFPAREIDGTLYVDGGVTGNILYGGRMQEEDSLPALWSRTHPNRPQPRIRFWVVFNNQLRPTPQVVPPTWPAIVTRSLETGTRFATITAMRQLYAQAEISRLKRGADMEVRYIAIPNDWRAPKPGVFIKETMNNLADLGEKMGADPASWKSESP